jgi:hypothetical protein
MFSVVEILNIVYLGKNCLKQGTLEARRYKKNKCFVFQLIIHKLTVAEV